MRAIILLLLFTLSLLSDTLFVRDSAVVVLINGEKKILKANTRINLEAGSMICLLEGDGKVTINNNIILNQLDSKCYQVNLSNNFKINDILSSNQQRIINETNSKNRSSKTELNNTNIELNKKDKELIIYDKTYGPLPVTLTVKNPDGSIKQTFVNKENDQTLFRVPGEYLQDNSKIEVTNLFGDLQLKSSITKKSEQEHQKIFYEKKDHTIIEILYGTDRKEETKKEKNAFYETFYGGKRGSLHYGLAKVSVPKRHKFGEMERPNSLWGEAEDKQKHILVNHLKELSLQEFSTILKSKLKFVEEKDIVVFIHGYNNTFADAIRRTAQLAYDLDFKGVPLTYSWPSQGNDKVLTYMEDEASIQYTVPHFVKFLTQIIENKKDANIHLIGHSMGTRALTNALKEISYIYRGQTLFKNVILAAPDIDRDVFEVSLLPYIQKATEMITLYSSSDDKALQVSQTLHGGERLGQSDNIFIYKGLHTIDATGIDTSSLGHSYFAEKEMLLNDLKEIIYKSLPPEKREQTLVKKTKKNKLYWKIKIKG